MLSDNIKVLRLLKGYKQSHLAELLSVNQRTVSAWENNISEPDISTLIKLKNIFGVSLDELIEGKLYLKIGKSKPKN